MNWQLIPHLNSEVFSTTVGEINRRSLNSGRSECVDPDEVAKHFRLERGSAIFILSKLAREGKINIQASGY
jgi:hypothetical protein